MALLVYMNFSIFCANKEMSYYKGFWYRFLVDAKIYEIEKRAKEEGVLVEEVIEEFLKIKYL